MKKLFSVVFFVLFLFSLSSLCLAAPEDSQEVDSSVYVESSGVQTDDLSQDLIVYDSVSGQKVIDSLIEALSFKSFSDSPVVGEELQLVDVQLLSVSPVTPSDTSGLKAALLGVLGDYDPVIVEYQYQSGNGYYSYLREIQPDYVWLCSAAFLLVVVFCLFKLGGAALSKR